MSYSYDLILILDSMLSHIFENEGYTFTEHTIKFTYQGAEGS